MQFYEGNWNYRYRTVDSYKKPCGEFLNMNDLPENSNNNEAGEIDTLDYLRGVKSSTCLLLPTTPSPTPLDFKHPLSEEMSERPFLTIDEGNMAASQNSGKNKVCF